MSAVIKSGQGEAVRHFGITAVSSTPAPKAKADPRDIKIAQLEAEVVRLHEALARTEGDAKKAVEVAHQKGVAAGLGQAEDREMDRLEALRSGLDGASERFEAALATLEGLAPQLAKASLEKLFGAVDDWSPMVEAMLERQFATLRRASVISVSVSPNDFADTRAVGALSGRALRAAIDPELRAGAARIDCKLGQIDLDVRAQWDAVARLLDEMSA